MNKTIIRNIALDIRRQLIKGIIEKISYLDIAITDSKDVKLLTTIFDQSNVNDHERILNKHNNNNEKEISNKIKEKGLEVLIEEVAYMWFVRLIAIRFMEVNEYICCNLKDSMFNKSNFIRLCNYLSELMPAIFETNEECMYLLLPNNMFGEKSIVGDLVEGIEEAYWKMELSKQEGILRKKAEEKDEAKAAESPELINELKEHGIEIIGWLHQYYTSIEKDEIFADLKKQKLKKDDIPAATQVFTPKWIVKYMVENSLGKLWQETHPNSNMVEKWKFYIEDTSEITEMVEKQKAIEYMNLSPESILFMDPAMGSGHILVYAFDVFYDIYEKEGYKKELIPRLILEKNLYGLDIDERVGKLANFALLMKARGKDENIFDKLPNTNIITIKESNGISNEAIDYFIRDIEDADRKNLIQNDLKHILHVFHDAKNFGAILKLKEVDFELIELRLEEIKIQSIGDFFELQYKEILLEKLPSLIVQGKMLSREYDIVVANPPYSGLRKFDDTLRRFAEENYADYKYDLFSIFMVRNINFAKQGGYAAFMTPNVWQFISSFEKLRNHIIDNYHISSLIQLDDEGFKDASVSISTFVIKKSNMDTNSTFIKLRLSMAEQVDEVENAIKNDVENKYIRNSRIFKRIPNSKIAFWVGENTIRTFEKGVKLEAIGKPRQGMATSDNKRFLRYWYEVSMEKICFSSDGKYIDNCKWIPYNKGGGYRKWYGNNLTVIDWEDDGQAVKSYAKKLYGNHTRTIKNEEFYFKEGITYTFIGKDIGPRYSDQGFIFDVAGSMIFVPNGELYYILGLMGSKLSNHYMRFLNPSINIQVGDIKNIPVIEATKKDIKNEIDMLVKKNIKLAKSDWDSYEISWDFKKHPLLTHKYGSSTIREAYNNWASSANERFEQLKENEERLNRIFINIYELNSEISPEVDDRSITIRRADEKREMKSFVSYAVSCMFGRYSLDEDSIIYAGGNFNDYFRFADGAWNVKTKHGWENTNISISRDYAVIIDEGENLGEDIVSRFVEFVELVFGKETLEENLSYISKILYNDSKEHSRTLLRKYFSEDFFSDHSKIYQKRPIYWLVKNEKDQKYLMYIHRYAYSNDGKLENVDLNDGIEENYKKIVSVVYKI